ncbi:MAG: inorganic phosphate transporter, partial [Bacteroidales bacterium]
YMLLRWFKRKTEIHLVRFESYIRSSLLIAGAFGAYSLGANNIANVMGVFIPAFNLNSLDLGLFTLNSSQQLFLLGGIAIAAGIITYSDRVMEVVGGSIVELSSEAALVVVLAQALILFIFSSTGLSHFFVTLGLPAIPMVPISSTQVLIGSVIGIGLYKGARNINFRIVGEIAAGWLATPLCSGLLAFFSLFFVENIFRVNIGLNNGIIPPGQAARGTGSAANASGLMQYLILSLLIAGTAALLIYYFLERKKRIEIDRSEEKFWKNMK